MKIDEGAALALARAWGVTWPITFGVEYMIHNGLCTTDFAAKRHVIRLSPDTDTDPEAVLRHEIGHAVDNERRVYVENAGNIWAAIDALDHECATLPYDEWPAELFARQFENRDRQIACVTNRTQRTIDKLFQRK